MPDRQNSNQKTMNGSKTFYRITNKDIYDKLESIDKKLGKINVRSYVNAGIIWILVLILAAIISGRI